MAIDVGLTVNEAIEILQKNNMALTFTCYDLFRRGAIGVVRGRSDQAS